MKIAVIGCGLVGSLIARLATSEKIVEEVGCFDKDHDRAKKYLSYPDPLDIPIIEADALNLEAFSGTLSNYDYLVNALPTFIKKDKKEILLNPLLMSVALKANINYVDLACYGGKRKRAEQLSMAKQFLSQGLLALINMGVSPGLANILAREAYEDLEEVDELSIMTLEDQKGSTFVIPWSREEMLNVASIDLAYKNKQFFFREPFAEARVCSFPEPIGSIRCYSVSNDEAYTIPSLLKINSFAYLAGGSDIEMLRALYRLGFFEDTPIKIRKTYVSPREFLYYVLQTPISPDYVVKVMEEGDLEDAQFALQVQAVGNISSEKAVSTRYIIFPGQRTINKVLPGATYITYPTALSLVAVLRAVKGKRLRGVLPGELLPRPIRRIVLDYIRGKKIHIGEEFKTIIE
jgi:saccharopine dehydrogenase-like NADP-dependent oxidoreductase